jgi:hypothetical protein
VIGALLLATNLASFPEPPGDSRLIDLGPLVGLWYLIVALRIGWSLRWVEEQAATGRRGE